MFALGGFKLAKMAWLTSQWNVLAVLGGTEDGCLTFSTPFSII